MFILEDTCTYNDYFTEHMPSVMSPSSQEKTTLKRFVDFVNKTDESSNEINHKLHKMLEELLIKNMHLQQVRLLFIT